MNLLKCNGKYFWLKEVGKRKKREAGVSYSKVDACVI